jgi:hypothetical protein
MNETVWECGGDILETGHNRVRMRAQDLPVRFKRQAGFFFFAFRLGRPLSALLAQVRNGGTMWRLADFTNFYMQPRRDQQ